MKKYLHLKNKKIKRNSFAKYVKIYANVFRTWGYFHQWKHFSKDLSFYLVLCYFLIERIILCKVRGKCGVELLQIFSLALVIARKSIFSVVHCTFNLKLFFKT